MHRLTARYLAGDPSLVPLIPWDWRSPPWEKVIQLRQGFPIDRRVLTQALLHQNAELIRTDPILRENIQALEAPHTYTVTTGQQPGWLTGPLYTLIKATHTLQLAQHLNQTFQGRYRFVPIFWIASEDHDAAEVRSIALSWQLRLEYEGKFSGPVGRHRIEAAFPPQAQSLALQRLWSPGKVWEAAFRESMQEIFRGSGLVWLSSDQPELKQLGTELWVQEIQNQLTYHAHHLAKDYLRQIGEKPSLHARHINLFWLSDTERRYPEVSEKKALLNAAYQTPERLSPNVLLRPLFQEYILPNVAYVAGPAEVAYWLELVTVFSAFDIPMPVIYPRGHLRILMGVPPPLPQGVHLTHLWSYSQSRLRTLLAEAWGEAILRQAEEWWYKHRPPHETLYKEESFRHAARALQNFWQKWGKQLRRAATRKAQKQYAREIKAALDYRSSIEPEGNLQERTLNIHAFSPEAPADWWGQVAKKVQLKPGHMSWYGIE
ncbi:MAG: bacillithiol biosynthesis cysteine-adding enzyme BshC [Bacteroidia bacterium]|nr:bacillithiol biosynthesis cysteine-adding enzyme BshC [Bacteroidia bacterium]MCX7652499.1 bacillithiol biosynthesis cysteine-adding enzyme BshC [Bacteroidia bacterium]MDW8416678.1 bacillithiol biosynthesis BshC [Bacteroidia bacterium]